MLCILVSRAGAALAFILAAGAPAEQAATMLVSHRSAHVVWASPVCKVAPKTSCRIVVYPAPSHWTERAGGRTLLDRAHEVRSSAAAGGSSSSYEQRGDALERFWVHVGGPLLKRIGSICGALAAVRVCMHDPVEGKESLEYLEPRFQSFDPTRILLVG